MKREQKLRAEGNIIEANALSAVGFSIMNLMAKVMELLQSNGSFLFLLLKYINSWMKIKRL